MGVICASRLAATKKLFKLRKKCKIDSGWASDCKVILEKLMKHPHSSPFIHLLVGFRHSGYLDIVKHPIDLSTVRKRLATHDYTHASEFESDVRHTFDNAMIYHPPHNQVHLYAKELMSFFDDLWKSIMVKDTTSTSTSTLTKKMASRVSNKKASVVNSKTASADQVANSAMQQQKEVSEQQSATSEVCYQYEEGEIHEHSPTKVLRVSKLKRKLSDAVTNSDRVNKCKQKKSIEVADSELEVKLQRQKERMAARMALEKMEKSIDVEDNFHVMREMESLVGYAMDYEPLWIGVDRILKRVSHDYVPVEEMTKSCESQPNICDVGSQQRAEVKASPSRSLRVTNLISRFGGIILKSQQSCMSQSRVRVGTTCNKEEVGKIEKEKAKKMEELEDEVRRCRQKEREAARMALEKVEQSVDVQDNFRVMREMETLFGYPVAYAPLWSS